ncbi:hypothetical protein M0R19_05465 [Candidatus Pacearchaeota archaeon]|nr:hypothetical protein [Candidatus Pacearchaeota archaeon]
MRLSEEVMRLNRKYIDKEYEKEDYNNIDLDFLFNTLYLYELNLSEAYKREDKILDMIPSEDHDAISYELGRTILDEVEKLARERRATAILDENKP